MTATDATDATAATTAAGRATAPPRPAYREIADRGYAVLSVLFVLALLVQVLFAGLGAFHGGFDLHETLGNALGITAGVLFIVSLIAWAGRWVVIGALVVGLLTEVAQHGLAQFGHDHPWIGAVHALDGMLILLLSVWLALAAARRCRRVRPGR